MRRSISTCRADLVLTGVTFWTRCLCQGLCSLAMAMADSVAREAEVSLCHKDGKLVANPFTSNSRPFDV
jgi:hypothetical protein